MNQLSIASSRTAIDRGSSSKPTQINVLSSFLGLPETIERMLGQRGLAATSPRLDGEAYLKIIQDGLDEHTLAMLSGDFQFDALLIAKFKSYLRRCGTEALAVNLYATELVNLLELLVDDQEKARVRPAANAPDGRAMLIARIAANALEEKRLQRSPHALHQVKL